MTEPGGYQVVARRYRPQLFADLVGQEHVARGLSGAIESGRIGHAYLFTGARGVGKTSAARIYAKALSCDRGPAAEPCNECDSCLAIAAGQDVDVVEIDAASNRGIDEIRQLRQNVAVRPARGRYKIYIIDEVHMLTREAFNALLKTLEEPPAHVKFVLCTTEPEKLPITILSRCQRFDFTTVDTPAIARRLAQIVEAEGADVSAEALTLIARRAAGSMRDSQSLLEQLLGSANGAIGVDEVHALIGTGREERIGELVAALAARDAARALAVLDASLEGGADAGGVLEQLLAALRDCLLASVGCEASLLTQSQGLGVDLAGLGGRLGTATLLAMLQILDQSLSRMRTSGHAALLAEMAVIRLATLEDLESVAAAVDRLVSTTATVSTTALPAAHARPTAPRPAAAPAPAAPQKKTTELTADVAESAASSPAVPAPIAATPVTTNAATDPAGTDVARPEAATSRLPEDAGEAWQAAVGVLEGLVVDFAAEVTAAAWRDDVLEVSLPAHAATAAAFLKRPEVAASVARALESLAGRRVRHAVVLAASIANEPASAAGSDSPPRPAPAQSQAALFREAGEHPLVAHARTVFDAAIRKVEPPRSREPRVAVPVAAAAVPPADGDDGRMTEDDAEAGMEEPDG
ncbi:MAG: DNA polymerase III subunit gamma/tau [Planctomycetia bacterium]|nr:DNA polymerase III subunit gamma/tau [Planctomycetia bacterium]